MLGVPAMRAGEQVTLPDSEQATAMAALTRVSRIHKSKGNTRLLGFVGDRLTDSSMLPEGEAPPQRLSARQALGGLVNPQVLKNKDCISRCPVDELPGGHPRKVVAAPSPPTSQPFEDATHAMRVLALCLLGRQLALHALGRLHRASVAHFGRFARDEQLASVRIHGHERIGLVQINADRYNPC